MRSEDQASQYIVDIRKLGIILRELSDAFRSNVPESSRLSSNMYSADNWRRNTYGNILVRLGQITENNFQVIETLSLLVTVRYVFEISVWLRLFALNTDYCLVYYREWLKKNEGYYKDSLSQLDREIALLKKFGQIEKESISSLMDKAIQSSSIADIGAKSKVAMDYVDAEAAKRFSLYADQAKSNGYDFQAYLVKKDAVPPIEAALADLQRSISEFERNVSENVRRLSKGKWKWRDMAETAGIVDEHDYIYSYASRLVHATPVSITTDQKNLELAEVFVFLKYIKVKLLEIIDLARSQPEINARTAS